MTTNLRFYLLHNCENYWYIDFSVINKDSRNWVKVVIRSNRKTQLAPTFLLGGGGGGGQWYVCASPTFLFSS